MPTAKISLLDLINPRSAQQIINDSLAFLASPPDPTLVTVRTANWRTGGPYRTLLYRMGLEGSLLYQVLAAFAGSAFLRYAAGKWLDWLGEDYFSEPRQSAEFATAAITVTVPVGAGPIGPIELRFATLDGKEFISTTLVTLPPGPATVTVSAKAALAGSSYNVGAGNISVLVSPNILDISVTNPAAAIGGYDSEPDQRYAQRLQAKWGALSTGSTQAVYVYWALTASQEVQKVRVYSDELGGVFADKYVNVLLAGLNSGVSPAAVLAVQNFIEPKIPLDAKLVAETAVTHPVSVTGNVKVFSAYGTSAHASIANSLQSLNVRVPIGSYDVGPVPLSEVQRAVAYDPSQVYDVALTNPTGPISLAYNELLVLSDSTTLVLV